MARIKHANRSENEVYLSPRELADALGVSESSLKRWADGGRLEVERTVGGHRRIPLGEAVRFVRVTGLRPVRPELLGLGEIGAGPTETEGDERTPAQERFHAALREDRGEEARSLLVSLYLDGAGLGWICDAVIRSALARVGELWRENEAGVFLEHRATETCARALGEIRRLLPPLSPEAAVALGGASAGDVYRLPSAMAALVLAEAGFRDRDLGADTPVQATAAAIRHYRPGLVWQSFSVPPGDPRDARLGLGRLARAWPSATLVVGGRAADSVPLQRHPGVVRLGSMAELAAFARGLVRPEPTPDSRSRARS